MRSSEVNTNGPTTESEFDSQLETLLRTAHDNGIDIEGGWAVKTDQDERPDFGIEIYKVETEPED